MGKTKMARAAIAVFCLALTGCGGCTRISPGMAGVKSTVTGTGRGLSEVAVGPAWVTYSPFTESVFEYPTSMQMAVWSANTAEGKPINDEITFSNKDSMMIKADVSLSYTLVPDKIPSFYMKFRTDDLDTFTHGFMKNVVRDAFNESGGKYTIDEIMGDNSHLIHDARVMVDAALTPYGVHIEQFGIVGIPRPPDPVIVAINEKVKAIQLAQQKQNELVQVQADAAKQVAQADGEAKSILAKAEAQSLANRKLAESLTPSFVEYQKVLKWDGRNSQVSGSGSGVLVNLNPAGR